MPAALGEETFGTAAAGGGVDAFGLVGEVLFETGTPASLVGNGGVADENDFDFFG